MKNHALLPSLLLLAGLCFGQSNAPQERRPESEITKVTVYLQNAQITREARLNVPQVLLIFVLKA